MIKMQHVDHWFGEKQVLDNVEFAIHGGEIFGLLGPSGAGKTTIINILTGQLKAARGEVHVLGYESANIKRSVYQEFGVVLDNPGLYERLSCYDNLLLFAEIYGIGKSVIAEALERVGLSDAAKRPAAKLSKGMKQRLVLARALLHNPRILLLDEPTGALDPVSAGKIHELIREQKEKGTAILLTTHNMEEAEKLCDQIALLDHGQIIERGQPDQLCRRYNHQDTIRILLKSGESIALPNQRQAAAAICGYFERGEVESIHSSEPNLESVFIELTGRTLEG